MKRRSDQILLIFRDESLELWTLNEFQQASPLVYEGGTNSVPLYFLITNDQVRIGRYPRELWLTGDQDAIGDFWNTLNNNAPFPIRFRGSIQITRSELLRYAIAEGLLPEICRTHFNLTVDEFCIEGKIIVTFEPGISTDHQIFVKQALEQASNNRPKFNFRDFWLAFTASFPSNKSGYILLNGVGHDLNVHVVNSEGERQLVSLSGIDADPQSEVLLQFLVEKAKAQGSQLAVAEIRKNLVKILPDISELIERGPIVQYTTNALDKPISFDFHRQLIQARQTAAPQRSIGIREHLMQVLRAKSEGEFKVYIYDDAGRLQWLSPFLVAERMEIVTVDATARTYIIRYLLEASDNSSIDSTSPDTFRPKPIKDTHVNPDDGIEKELPPIERFPHLASIAIAKKQGISAEIRHNLSTKQVISSKYKVEERRPVVSNSKPSNGVQKAQSVFSSRSPRPITEDTISSAKIPQDVSRTEISDFRTLSLDRRLIPPRAPERNNKLSGVPSARVAPTGRERQSTKKSYLAPPKLSSEQLNQTVKLIEKPQGTNEISATPDPQNRLRRDANNISTLVEPKKSIVLGRKENKPLPD